MDAKASSPWAHAPELSEKDKEEIRAARAAAEAAARASGHDDDDEDDAGSLGPITCHHLHGIRDAMMLAATSPLPSKGHAAIVAMRLWALDVAEECCAFNCFDDDSGQDLRDAIRAGRRMARRKKRPQEALDEASLAAVTATEYHAGAIEEYGENPRDSIGLAVALAVQAALAQESHDDPLHTAIILPAVIEHAAVAMAHAAAAVAPESAVAMIGSDKVLKKRALITARHRLAHRHFESLLDRLRNLVDWDDR